MKKISVGLIGIAALGLLGACSSTNDAKVSNDKDGKLEIVTTFYPMYDFTKNIVGDEANVDLMVPAGSEPHDYEPSAKDMAKLMMLMFLYIITKTWNHGYQKLKKVGRKLGLM